MTFAVIALAILVAALVQGSVGFGFALVAAPVMSAARPELVPVTVIVVGTVLSVLMLRREHAAVDLGGMPWLLAGLVPGTIAGAVLLASVSTRTLQVLVAVSVLAGVTVNIVRPVIAAGPGVLLGAGVVSGIFGTTSSIPGPPVALAYSDRAGATLRATLALFFLVSGGMSFAGAGVAGAVHGSALRWSVGLVPAVVVGFLLSGPFARRVDGAALRAAVLVVSAVAATVLLVRAL